MHTGDNIYIEIVTVVVFVTFKQTPVKLQKVPVISVITCKTSAISKYVPKY